MSKKIFGIPVVAILALVAVFVVGVVFLVWGMGNDVVTTVTLDVNPGIEMGLNIHKGETPRVLGPWRFFLRIYYDNRRRISCSLC